MRAKKLSSMIVASYNIRGLGGRVKRRRIRELAKGTSGRFFCDARNKIIDYL
jgi:hypothetical protein